MSSSVKPFDTYYGGKSGSGTYQSIINRITPHNVFFSLCLGNCGITRHIRPARLSFLNDIDPDVIASWKNAIGDQENYVLINMDAEDVIRYLIAPKHDTAATFIYIDLPYLFSTRKGQRPVYRFEADEFKHRAIINAAKALKHARVMFSHYPNDLYDELLAGWQTFDFYSTTRQGQAHERIYFNYQITDQLHDYSYLGEDFREREALSRVRKNFIRKLKRLDPLLRNAIFQDLASQNKALTAVPLASIAKINGLEAYSLWFDEALHLASSQIKEV